MILAIDPGPERSAWARYSPVTNTFVEGNAVYENFALLCLLGLETDQLWDEDILVIEWMDSYQKRVGADVFLSLLWGARFANIWSRPAEFISRRQIKLHLVGSAASGDADVRQTLLDRFGPGREKAVGTKKHPGPLYGIKTHLWSALAVAVTFAETREERKSLDKK